MNANLYNQRRGFIKNATVGGLLSLGINEKVVELVTSDTQNKIQLKENDIILFQGDSITDAGREYNEKRPNNTARLGAGYTLIATSELLYKNPIKNLTFYNRGIGGEKVPQLAARWKADCLDLKPTILSILIGVNDFWHTFKGYSGTPKSYRNDYQQLLDRTKQALPDVKLLIGEPFYVAGIPGNYEKVYPEFKEYQVAAQEMAKSFGAVFIPYQSIFDKAQQRASGEYWTWDGVHTTPAGAYLMAQEWLNSIKA